MTDDITLDDLADAIDAEIRNKNRGMTLGFISNVDRPRGDVLTRGPGDDAPVRRPAENVLTLLNDPDASWEVYDGAATNTL